MKLSDPARGLVLCLAAAASAAAQQDRVRTLDGSEPGEVVAATRDGVTLRRDGERIELPVDTVRGVLYGDEPSELRQARINFENAGYATALETLATIDAGDIDDPLIAQDLAYYTAAAKARRAIAGVGDPGEAGRALRAFVREHGETSFHYYGALETTADLLAALGKTDGAVRLYDRLANAKPLSFKARGAVLAGEALQGEGRHDEAITRFDAALAVRGQSPALARELAAAKLGKAVSLAATGDAGSAIALASGVVRSAREDDEALRAAGYNALGRCHAEAGQTTDALLALLHTDLLFNGDAETHAEALYRLAPLWRKSGKPTEADDALARLRRRYASTVWASRVENGG